MSRFGRVGAVRSAETASWLGILLAAFGLRATALPKSELGLDGFLSVGLSTLPLREMLDFSLRDVHPPLYYAALKAWLAVAGTASPAARWPSVACGVLAVALVYVLIRSLWGAPPAVLAGALLAASPSHVLMSATVRDFALGMLLSLASLWLILPVFTGKTSPSTARVAALSLTTLLALYTWYMHLVALAAQVACLLILRPRGSRRYAAALVGAGIAYLPWAGVALPELMRKTIGGITVSGGPRTPLPVDAFVLSLGESLVGVVPRRLGLDAFAAWSALYWLLLCLGGIALGLARPRQSRGVFVLAGVGLVAGLAVLYGLRWAWVGADNPSRYLLAVLPFGLMGQIGLLVLAPGRWRWLALAALLLLLPPALGGHWRLRGHAPVPWLDDSALGYVQQNGQPGDAVLFCDIARLGLYRALSSAPLPSYHVHFSGSRFLWDDVPEKAPQVVDFLARRYSRVWFVNTSPQEERESHVVDGLLASSYYIAEWRSVSPQVLLKLYVTGPRPTLTPVGHTLGGQICLTRRGVTADVTALYVGLEWQALRRPDSDYSVFVHLVDASGRTVSQHDGWPGAGLRPTSRWTEGESVLDYHVVALPQDRQTGEYEIRVGLYQGSTRLTSTDGSNYVVVGWLRRAEGAPPLLSSPP